MPESTPCVPVSTPHLLPMLIYQRASLLLRLARREQCTACAAVSTAPACFNRC